MKENEKKVKKPKKTDFFSCNDYRVVLEFQRNQQRELNSKKYSIQNLADACGIHRSYLSKVIHEKAHLSEDQLYLAMEFMGFDEKKREFTELLYQIQRSEIPTRIKNLKDKLQKFKKTTREHSAGRDFEELGLTESEKNLFYLTPHNQLVFLLLTIERYRDDFKKIIDVLELDEKLFLDSLEFLSNLGVIKYDKGKVKIIHERMNFGFDSRIVDAYHSLARNRSFQRFLGAHPDQKNAYTVLFTVTDSKYQKLREIRKKFLDDFNETLRAPNKSNEPTNLYEFHCDIFPWLKD